VILTPRKSAAPSRIVHAATALFSEQGYRGTSTKDIARLADVSEVTIYRYFEHKEDIFWSALVSSFEAIRPRFDSLKKDLQSLSPAVAMPQILRLLADATTLSPALLRLILVALMEHRGKAEAICHQQLGPLFCSITDYLTANIEAGRIRDLNPAMVTVAIALSVITQPQLAKLSGVYKLKNPTGREAINEYAKFWLSVLEPSSAFRSDRVEGVGA
jgi:AcrR family transcriptional regulator